MADQQKPVAPATDAAKATPKVAPRVRLRTAGPKDRFDLSARGFGVVDYNGKDYSQADADEVRTLAMKYGVKLIAVKKED